MLCKPLHHHRRRRCQQQRVWGIFALDMMWSWIEINARRKKEAENRKDENINSTPISGSSDFLIGKRFQKQLYCTRRWRENNSKIHWSLSPVSKETTAPSLYTAKVSKKKQKQNQNQHQTQQTQNQHQTQQNQTPTQNPTEKGKRKRPKIWSSPTQHLAFLLLDFVTSRSAFTKRTSPNLAQCSSTSCCLGQWRRLGGHSLVEDKPPMRDQRAFRVSRGFCLVLGWFLCLFLFWRVLLGSRLPGKAKLAMKDHWWTSRWKRRENRRAEAVWVIPSQKR